MVSFEEVKRAREHIIINDGFDDERSVNEVVKGSAVGRDDDADVNYPTGGPGDNCGDNNIDIHKRSSVSNAGEEEDHDEVEGGAGEVGE